MSEKIKVRIECSQRVSYDQTVEMTREEWEKIKAKPRRKMENCDTSPLNSWLDLRNPITSDDFDDVELDVVDSNGEPVKPADSYEGGNA
ncbi:MAG: hypothetical protein U1F65_05140 [Verrucomicrobiota bacterium]